MLIEKVIEHLQAKVSGIELFEKIHGLTEIMENGDGKYAPHEYQSKGAYKRIDISGQNGVVYFRKNGDVTNSDASDNSAVACENVLGITIPLKILAFKNKKELPDDCAYSDDYLSERIIPAITTRNGALKSTLSAKLVSINFSSYSTDSRSIYQGETNMDSPGEVNPKIACCSININVYIEIDKNCFDQICTDGY